MPVSRSSIEPQLEPHGWHYVGNDWSGWDFEHKNGSRLEVKQSAAKQRWCEPRNLRRRGAFDIAHRFDKSASILIFDQRLIENIAKRNAISFMSHAP
jgi:hypothetical protein